MKLMAPDFEVIIPAYNEGKTLPGIIKEIKDVGGKLLSRIIVVDDASEDNTAEAAKDAGAEVVSRPYRMGNGASIKAGLRKATSDIVVFMDADGQHNPEDVLRLVECMDSFDMVVGARNFGGFSRRDCANKFYNLFASYVTGFPVKDLTSGLRAVRRQAAVKFIYLLPNGFSYPTTLTLAFLKTGRAIKYVPVSSSIRKHGKSKINLGADGIRFLLIIAKIATFFSPLRVFLPVSMLFFATGLVYYLYTYLAFHRLTNMSVFLLNTSVIIFMLGLISEQIAQLRMDRTEEK